MEDCAVCLCELESQTTLGCGHSFHEQCIKNSGLTSPHACPPCPLCREPVRECQEGLEALNRFEMSGLLMGDVKILERAAAFGSVRCAHELGNIYFQGIGVPSNKALGEKYWKESTQCFGSCSRLAYLECDRKNTLEAIAYFRMCLVLNPNAASHMVKLAKLLGPTQEAYELFTKAAELYADYPESQADISFSIGVNLVKVHRHEEASAHFELCVEQNPRHFRGRMMAALTTVDAAAAHAHIDYIITVDPQNIEAICLKARLHLEDDNIDGADRFLHRASQVAPNAEATVRLQDHMRRFKGPLTRKRARLCSGR